MVLRGMKRRDLIKGAAALAAYAALERAEGQILNGVPGCGPGVPTTALGGFGVPNGCAPGVPNATAAVYQGPVMSGGRHPLVASTTVNYFNAVSPHYAVVSGTRLRIRFPAWAGIEVAQPGNITYSAERQQQPRKRGEEEVFH